MTRYTVRAPDGKMLVIEGPAGASETDVMAQAQQLYKPTLRTQTAPAPALTPQQLAMRDAAQRQASVPPQVRAFTNGSTLGLANLLDAAGAAGETGLYNLTHPGQGKYGMADAFNAVRQTGHNSDTQFAADHPFQSGGIGLLGMLATPGLGAVARGTEAVTKGVVGAVANPTVRAVAKYVAPVVIGGAAASPVGFVNGAATAAPGQEIQGGINGAQMAAAMGGASPSLSYGAGQAVKGAAVVAKTLARAANKATGGQLLDPMRVAAQRLAEAMKADKVDPDTARTVMNQWLTSGVKPALLDVVPQGGNTQALLRGSTMTGDGRMIAKNYAAKVAADTQDTALALTRRLTLDNTQTAAQHTAQLEAKRAAQAETDYKAPYAEQVPVAPVTPALTGPEGERAISTAVLNASANKTTPEIAARIPELEAMQNAGGNLGNAPVVTRAPSQVRVDPLTNTPQIEAVPSTVQYVARGEGLPIGTRNPVTNADPTASVGALDQIKIALQRHAADLAENGQNLRAKGYGDLADLVDQHLANNSDLYATARDNYAANSRPIDAVELGSKAMQPGVNPVDYADQLSGLGDGALPSAQVGLRSTLEQQIGAPTEGSTGFLNRVSTGTNPTQILDSTFGPEAAQGYQAGIGNVVDKLNNARFIDQSSGSQTAGRLADLVSASAVHGPPTTLHGAVFAAINKIRQGATLTDAEKAAIAHFGTSDAQSVNP